MSDGKRDLGATRDAVIDAIVEFFHKDEDGGLLFIREDIHEIGFDGSIDFHKLADAIVASLP